MLAFKIFAKWEDGTTFDRTEMGCPYYDEHPDEAEKRYKGVISAPEFSGLHGECLMCKVTPFEIPV